MYKVTFILLFSLLILASTAFAQEDVWNFDKILIDYDVPQDNGTGVHGVAVAPDGNIWLSLHGGMANDTGFVDGDTILYRPIHVLDTDGNHVAFSPIRWLDRGDGTIDTLHAGSIANGSGKGISVDNDGNILATSFSSVFRINYQTGEGMNAFIPADVSSMTEAVQSSDGFIYVGYVLGAARPIYLLDANFNLVGNAVDTLGHITRTLAITPDGNDLYVGSAWNGFGIEHFHSDVPGLIKFAPVDTIGNFGNVTVDDTTYEDVKLWSSCLDWDPDGNLLAGNLRDDWSSGGALTGSRYYAFDVETGEVVYSVGDPIHADTLNGNTYSPRGAAWSADGQTMYLADFDYNFVSVWSKSAATIEQDGEIIARTYRLDQNYPNPFNPVTTIPFVLYKNTDVELKVFDLQGREVATLINKPMDAGNHEYSYNASSLSSGTYFYQLKVSDQILSKKMILVK